MSRKIIVYQYMYTKAAVDFEILVLTVIIGIAYNSSQSLYLLQVIRRKINAAPLVWEASTNKAGEYL